MRLRKLEKERLDLLCEFAEAVCGYIEAITEVAFKIVEDKTPPGGADPHSDRRPPPAGGRSPVPPSGELKGKKG